MPEMRVSGRRRRSIGFPMLTLMVLVGFGIGATWLLGELFPTLRLWP